jgi:hypothetical protein
MRPIFAGVCLIAIGVPAGAAPDDSPDIDPLALQVLKATCEPIKKAESFSFHAVVAKESLGTNGQIITLFNDQQITLERPDKIRVEFKSAFHNVTLYDNQGTMVLYSPEEKLYANIQAAKNIDQTLTNLDKRDISIPMSPLLRNDPYETLINGIKGAAVIGRAEFAGKTVTHLAFSEPDSEWQLWVEGGEHPSPLRMEIVYTSLPRQPRISIDFLDWNLEATPDADTFTFQKPADAHEIEFLKLSPHEGGE